MTAQFTFCVQMPSGRTVEYIGHADFDREERHWIAMVAPDSRSLDVLPQAPGGCEQIQLGKGISDDCVIACADAVRNAMGPCFLPSRKEGA